MNMTFKDCINTQGIKAYVDQAIADIPTGSGWDPLTIDNIRDYFRDMNGMTVVTNDMVITIPVYQTVDNVERKFGVCQAYLKAGEQFRIPYFGTNINFVSSPFDMEYLDCFVWYGLGNFIVTCTIYMMAQDSTTKDIGVTETSLTLSIKNDLSGYVNPVQPR
jgi:hypothetical protein